MSKGELDAVLNFWHFSARLKAKGMQELIGVSDILPALGVNGDVPLLGWVFREDWAAEQRPAVEGFLRAARKAGELMQQDDQLWDEYLRPMSNAEDDATLVALRDSYRIGIPQQFGAAEIEVAAKVFEILARLGGEDLVGSSTALQPGTFWEGYSF
jgi:NitT/TauT family transport system substrate-binding protein